MLTDTPPVVRCRTCDSVMLTLGGAFKRLCRSDADHKYCEATPPEVLCGICGKSESHRFHTTTPGVLLDWSEATGDPTERGTAHYFTHPPNTQMWNEDSVKLATIAIPLGESGEAEGSFVTVTRAQSEDVGSEPSSGIVLKEKDDDSYAD